MIIVVSGVVVVVTVVVAILLPLRSGLRRWCYGCWRCI